MILYLLLSSVVHIVCAPVLIGRALYRGTSWQAMRRRWFYHRTDDVCDLLFHAVSVGEVVAISPLIQRFQARLPALKLALTTSTETGLAEARRRLPNIKSTLLPLDTAWGAPSMMRQLRPRALFLSEGDLWPGMLYTLYKRGIPVIIVNAKCSDRSWRIWHRLRWIARWLYRPITLCLCQDTQAQERLQQLCISANWVKTTGNLKQDVIEAPISAAEALEWRQRLNLNASDRVVLLASTHPGEEYLLLKALLPLLNQGWKVLVVPRHVHRKHDVAAAVTTAISDTTLHTSISCVFEMGVLTKLMQLSSVVIVGGSFIHGIGGHNLLEPGHFGKPVLFGPEHYKQSALAQTVYRHNLGACVNLEQLATAVLEWAGRPVQLQPDTHSPLELTWDCLCRQELYETSASSFITSTLLC